jgi:hypothetical protein
MIPLHTALRQPFTPIQHPAQHFLTPIQHPAQHFLTAVQNPAQHFLTAVQNPQHPLAHIVANCLSGDKTLATTNYNEVCFLSE